MKVKKITLIGLLAACLCILAPVSFPIGVIPISLATFAIYIIASLLVWHNTILVILVYIVIGAVGLPVFSGFRGGFSILLGYTGGYIFGYILMGLAISLLLKNNKNKIWMYPIAMLVGTIFCYLFGSIWYMVESNNNLAIICPPSSITYNILLCIFPRPSFRFLVWILFLEIGQYTHSI